MDLQLRRSSVPLPRGREDSWSARLSANAVQGIYEGDIFAERVWPVDRAHHLHAARKADPGWAAGRPLEASGDWLPQSPRHRRSGIHGLPRSTSPSAVPASTVDSDISESPDLYEPASASADPPSILDGQRHQVLV